MLFREVVYFLVVFKKFLCSAYDITLDDEDDIRGWSFKGHYTYRATLSDGGNFTPPLKRLIGSQPLTANGVWYFAYTEQPSSNGSLVNYAEIKFSLTHHLMAEVMIRFLANPSVVVEMHGSRGKLLQMFRSTGQEWCDASFDIWKQLGSEVRISTNLTEPGFYLLVDRVTIGSMSLITTIDRNTLKPCEVVSLPFDKTTYKSINR